MYVTANTLQYGQLATIQHQNTQKAQCQHNKLILKKNKKT